MFFALDAVQVMQRDRQQRFEAASAERRLLRTSMSDPVVRRPRRPGRWRWLSLARISDGATASPRSPPTHNHLKEHTE